MFIHLLYGGQLKEGHQKHLLNKGRHHEVDGCNCWALSNERKAVIEPTPPAFSSSLWCGSSAGGGRRRHVRRPYTATSEICAPMGAAEETSDWPAAA